MWNKYCSVVASNLWNRFKLDNFEDKRNSKKIFKIVKFKALPQIPSFRKNPHIKATGTNLIIIGYWLPMFNRLRFFRNTLCLVRKTSSVRNYFYLLCNLTTVARLGPHPPLPVGTRWIHIWKTSSALKIVLRSNPSFDLISAPIQKKWKPNFFRKKNF